MVGLSSPLFQISPSPAPQDTKIVGWGRNQDWESRVVDIHEGRIHGWEVYTKEKCGSNGSLLHMQLSHARIRLWFIASYAAQSC